MTEIKMSTFKCTCCDYNSNRSYNLSRHMVIKHAQQNVNMPQQNVIIEEDDAQNILFECSDCSKVFNKQWILTRHKKICTGLTNSLLCTNCNKVFASRQSKSIHIKKCELRKEHEQEELDANNTTIIDNSTINNITNNNTTNNTNNTLNNTTNNNTLNNNAINNTVNIITFKNSQTELMPISDKSIEKIIRLMKYRDTKNHKNIMEIIRQFVEYSLDVYQNRFVIKNNLRSSYSRVHCGDNNWRHIMDSVILPQFANIMIGSFQELIPKEKYKFMYEYVDEMYSHGDLKYNSQACKDYTILLNHIRLKLYDLTKDMKFPSYYDSSNTELIKV